MILPQGPRLRQHWLSVFILFHLVAMGASLFKDTALGATVRSATAPYERLLGIWQSWGMFGPNPPMGTSWLHATGTSVSGEKIELQTFFGERGSERFDWHYHRLLKVERSMFSPTKKALRAHYALWHCRQQAEAGQPLAEVTIWKENHKTPTPKARRSGKTSGRVKRIEYKSVECP